VTVRLGVDLGGSKIEVLALGPDGAELARERQAAPRGDYGATIEAVALMVEGVEARLGLTGTVGVGIPGAVSPATGLIKHANSTWLIGRPFERDLAARLRRPVRLANDADCFALSEATDGAATGACSVFGAILGTGTGGGVTIRGRLVQGPNAIAGEWGHNPLPWPRDDERPGPPCYCGKSGCTEMFLSGPGLARDYAANGGTVAPATELPGRIGAGEPAACAALARYADRLARALATVINLIDPEVVVLGGGVSYLPGLIPATAPLLPRYVFSTEPLLTRLVLARFGDSSGVRGAAWQWPG
jgi:fructokinase